MSLEKNLKSIKEIRILRNKNFKIVKKIVLYKAINGKTLVFTYRKTCKTLIIIKNIILYIDDYYCK